MPSLVLPRPGVLHFTLALVFVPFGAPRAAAVMLVETSRIAVCAAAPGDPDGLASTWETPGTRAGTAAVPVMVCFGVAVDVPHFTVR